MDSPQSSLAPLAHAGVCVCWFYCLYGVFHGFCGTKFNFVVKIYVKYLIVRENV